MSRYDREKNTIRCRAYRERMRKAALAAGPRAVVLDDGRGSWVRMHLGCGGVVTAAAVPAARGLVDVLRCAGCGRRVTLHETAPRRREPASSPCRLLGPSISDVLRVEVLRG